MVFNPTALNITMVGFIALTLWLILFRYRAAREATWPLFYYFGLIMLANYLPGRFNLNFVYAGLIFALLLRFEFMSRSITNVVRISETLLLSYFIWASWASME